MKSPLNSRLRAKNRATLVALLTVCALFYAIAILRMSGL